VWGFQKVRWETLKWDTWTIGAGRVLYQDLVKISLALENGDLKKNRCIK